MIWYLAGTIAMALAAMLIFLYYYRAGQFIELEDVKYQMFRNEEE